MAQHIFLLLLTAFAFFDAAQFLKYSKLYWTSNASHFAWIAAVYFTLYVVVLAVLIAHLPKSLTS